MSKGENMSLTERLMDISQVVHNGDCFQAQVLIGEIVKEFYARGCHPSYVKTVKLLGEVANDIQREETAEATEKLAEFISAREKCQRSHEKPLFCVAR